MRSLGSVALGMCLVACASTPAAPDAGPVDAAFGDATSDATSDAELDGSLPLGPPFVLASSAGKDEDPSLLRAADGTFYLAWYSNRDGNDRVWLKTSTNGRDWTSDRAITPPAEAHFNPTLIQSKDGLFHLVTWHGALTDAGAIGGSVRYVNSADTLTWSAPLELTGANALSWAPTITERTPGELVVLWSSNETGEKDLYVRRSQNGGSAWGAPAKIADPATNDDLPFLVTRADQSLMVVYQRYDVSLKDFKAPFGDLSNELAYRTSADGVSWSAPIAITKDPPGPNYPDITPSLFPSVDPSGWAVAWSSFRGKSVTGDISTLGLSAVPVTQTNVKMLVDQAGVDYSARLVSAGAPGRFLMAWVSDRGGNLDIYGQVVAR